jgi:two-component system, OmpR family, phosphate regulon response regulator PhoB
MAIRVLVIEDDPDVAEVIEVVLKNEGYKVSICHEGEEGLELARVEIPDVLLLDWVLPNLSGLEICRRMRRIPETQAIPIVMLTARAEEDDKIRGLDTGADDYISKPFSNRELVARINAVMRRARPGLSGQMLEFEDIRLDSTAHKVSRGNDSIHLGPTEYKLLRHFMESPGRVYSREQLLDSVWGNDVYVEIRTVDVHIRRLRKALNDGGKPDLIRTVRAAGYALDKPA